MLLANKTAVIYGAGGAIGSAVAHTFAAEGAQVFLAGRTLEKLNSVARDISAVGGVVEAMRLHAESEGISPEVFEARIAGKTLLKPMPKLAEVANVAALMASDRANTITGAVTNVTCGEIVD